MAVARFPGAEPAEEFDLPPQFSDDALALEFTERHKHELRYVAKWSAWLYWDGTRWKFEDTHRAFDLARAVARDSANACHNPGLKPKIASASKVSAIITLARADRAHAATVGSWDGSPWLLNTPAGVVDLSSGGLIPHEPSLCLTKITAVGPKEVRCPRWLKFLQEVTGGDMELEAFLQRVAGYALTGSTREHALFFLYGTGNGKGVFLNTLTAVLGDYATVAPMETFIVARGERHPTDLAGLRGARLVTSQETEEGRHWAEAKIKALTGGDPISARFMRQDFFTFIPSFKLIFAGNHKPRLQRVDEAIRCRMHLIPFDVTIPPMKRDAQLPDTLREEWPGILQWAIEGCLMWQKFGLSPPPAVLRSTEEYLASQDLFAQWLEECCSLGPNLQQPRNELFASWKTWIERIGEQPSRPADFYDVLASRFEPYREPGKGTRLFRGIALRDGRDSS